jgi:hypothetical protein
MSRTITVSSLPDGQQESHYDLFLCALGYEERARFVPQEAGIKAEQKVALGFPWQHQFSYERNAGFLTSRGFEIAELDDAKIAAWFSKQTEASRHGGKLRACIDISSLSRLRIAILIDILRNSHIPEITVDFLYALAKFGGPPAPAPPNEHAGPVLPSFSGWSLEPERGPTAIVGLGYEQDKALGAVELMQASRIWTLEPVSGEIQYTPQVERANETLLSYVPVNNRLIYRVESPFTLFLALESLVYGALQQYNPVILPFGPKVFALASLLVASIYPEVAVWRVSGGRLEQASDRGANGHIGGLSVSFGN